MAAREAAPLALRLLTALRPELDRVAEEALDELDNALGPEGVDRVRAASVAVGKVLDLLESRRAPGAAGPSRPRGR
ncbi:MAG TPA: hypothetical protein VLS89_14825 [Candidatus Nanopelagicales bacterium]|nr:hypothetical protein [Candidatus Nanopelagicales bacterium]